MENFGKSVKSIILLLTRSKFYTAKHGHNKVIFRVNQKNDNYYFTLHCEWSRNVVIISRQENCTHNRVKKFLMQHFVFSSMNSYVLMFHKLWNRWCMKIGILLQKRFEPIVRHFLSKRQNYPYSTLDRLNSLALSRTNLGQRIYDSLAMTSSPCFEI